MKRGAADALGQQLLLAGESTALLNRVKRLREGTPLFMRSIEPVPFWYDFGLHLGRLHRGSTLRDYATLAALFARFLDGRGLRVADVSEADIVEYREGRTQEFTGVSLSSWKSDATVIKKVFDYAIHVGECTRYPWFEGARTSALRQPIHVQDDNRGLTEMEWLQFKQVGLLGRTPDGSLDSAFRTVWGLRNLAGAQLALSTGLRVQEFSTLLLPEILSPPAARGGLHLTLEATTKGKRRRTIHVPAGVLSRIRSYVRTDRQALIASRSRRLTKTPRGAFVVDAWQPGDTRLSGSLDGHRRTIEIAKMDSDLRLHTYFRLDGELQPLALFVNSWGRMTSRRTWHRVFQDASSRVASFDGTLPGARFVTPHRLRHTFARRYLAFLNREARLNADDAEWGEIDPLVLVQRALGHADRSTTSKYVSEDRVSSLVEHLFHIAEDPFEEFSDIVERHLAERTGARSEF